MKNIFKLFTLIIVILMLGVLLNPANAEVPHLINYQGRLTDSSGAPLNGSYNIVFRIYDAETTGTLLWQGTYANVPLTKGIFSILLGDVNDTGYSLANLAFDKPYWLEIKVGTDEPMKPRQRIASVGYAIRADKADSLTMPAQQGDILYYDGSSWAKLAAGSPGQILQTQGPGNKPQWAEPAFSHVQVFTKSGTFVKPPGVNMVMVEVIGGGGGGGGPADGGTGGTSSFGNYCSASGGAGGTGKDGGAGGTGIGGDINGTGGKGGAYSANYNNRSFYYLILTMGRNGINGGSGGGIGYFSDAYDVPFYGGSGLYGEGGSINSPGKGYGGGGGGNGQGSGGGGGGYAKKFCTISGDVPVTIGAGGTASGLPVGAGGAVIVYW